MAWFRLKIVSIAIGKIMCSGLGAASVLMATDIHAQQVASTQYYQIAAGSLAQVLERFESHSGIQLERDNPSQLQQIQSQGLNGNYTPQEGLQNILHGTHIGLRKPKQGTE